MNRPGNSVWGDRQAKERRRTDKPQRSTSHSMAHQTSASAEAWPAADCRCLDIRRHVARAPFFASQRLLSRGLDPPKRSTPKDAPLSEHLDTGSCHGRGLGGACRSTAVSGTSRDHAGYAMGAPCNARRHCWRAILQKRHGAHLSEHRRLFRTQQRPHPVPPQPPRPRTEILRRFPHPSTTPGRWACWPRSRS